MYVDKNFDKGWCVFSSVSHSLNEAPIPYNVLLLRCRLSIVACPPEVHAHIATGLALASLLGGVRRLWSIKTFRSLPDRQAELDTSGLWMEHVEKELTKVHKNNLAEENAFLRNKIFLHKNFDMYRKFVIGNGEFLFS